MNSWWSGSEGIAVDKRQGAGMGIGTRAGLDSRTFFSSGEGDWGWGSLRAGVHGTEGQSSPSLSLTQGLCTGISSLGAYGLHGCDGG